MFGTILMNVSKWIKMKQKQSCLRSAGFNSQKKFESKKTAIQNIPKLEVYFIVY